jgi:hypothetical protein
LVAARKLNAPARIAGWLAAGRRSGMRVLEVGETADVAGLLRALADDVERGTLKIQGHTFDVSSSLRAIVTFPDSEDGPVARIELHPSHPAPKAWDAMELRIEMSHPGD